MPAKFYSLFGLRILQIALMTFFPFLPTVQAYQYVVVPILHFFKANFSPILSTLCTVIVCVCFAEARHTEGLY